MKPALRAVAGAIALAIGTFAAAEDGRYVDSATIRQVQQALNERGAKVAADGVMGPSTEAAIESFQRAQSLEPTGNLNRQTLTALGFEPQAAERAPEFVYGAATIRQVQQTLNNRGFKAGRVDGTISSNVESALREFQRSENLEPSGDLNPRTLSALGIKAEPVSAHAASTGAHTVRDVQQALKSRGFLAGPVDGVLGPTTERAIRQFQQSENLESTGHLNRQTLAALGVRGG